MRSFTVAVLSLFLMAGCASSTASAPPAKQACDVFYDDLRPQFLTDPESPAMVGAARELAELAVEVDDERLAGSASGLAEVALGVAEGTGSFEGLLMMEGVVRADCQRLGLE